MLTPVCGVQLPGDREIAEHLAGMLIYKTISNNDPTKIDPVPFEGFRAYLEKTYPLLHKTLERRLINQHALLYRWAGTGASGRNGILLMAHQDVVPVEPGTEQDWVHDAFAGDIDDEFVWGRGSLDIKNAIMGAMEGVEALIAAGFTPDRDVYLAFGHDEEVLGHAGAEAIAASLKAQGITVDLVLDEGGGFGDGAEMGAPGVLLASIGVFEKGYLDVKLEASHKGGHSSVPEDDTALSILAKAILAVQEHPFPYEVTAPLSAMYKAVGPYLEDEELKAAALGLPETEQAFTELIARTPKGRAMLRTTTAGTQAFGAPAPNIMPQKAQAVFNFRLSPVQTVEDVVAWCELVIADDRVSVSIVKGQNASIISRMEGESFEILSRTIHQMRPEAVIVPKMVLGGTDARHFGLVSPGVYRFTPFIGAMHLHDTVHGTNERMPIAGLQESVSFYVNLIYNLCSEQGRKEQ
ncbi:MAG: M20/M25/M40 family metallo-hydrolase [Clostridia bacterium]|nr:M20/M25/M40 family metallo-hydrolase [Clostridia bacterium]